MKNVKFLSLLILAGLISFSCMSGGTALENTTHTTVNDNNNTVLETPPIDPDATTFINDIPIKHTVKGALLDRDEADSFRKPQKSDTDLTESTDEGGKVYSSEIKTNTTKTNNTSLTTEKTSTTTTAYKDYTPTKKDNLYDEYIALMEKEDPEQVSRAIDDSNLDMTNRDYTSTFEMPLSETTVQEGEKLTIVLKAGGWTLQTITPRILSFESRNSTDSATTFIFEADKAGSCQITFIRYNDISNTLTRKPYSVTVRPKEIITITETDSSAIETDSTAQNEEEMDYRKKLALTLFNQQKYPEAKKRFLSLIDDGKGDPEIFYKMGIILLKENNEKDAVNYFTRTLNEKDHPFYFDALLELIRILKDQEKYSEAIDSFFNYVMSADLSGKAAEKLYLLLADVYFNMKDYASASNEYRRFLEIFPLSMAYDKALFYLAYSLEHFAINPDYKEAYRLYNKLVTTYPESEYYLLSKKRILFLERHFLKLQ